MENTQLKKAVVAGSARCLFDDLKVFEDQDFDLVVVNEACLGFLNSRPIAHLATRHWELAQAYALMCEGGGRYPDRKPVIHSVRAAPGVDKVWLQAPHGGGSGLLGAYVALSLGYQRIAVAGMPMDNSGHFYDPPNYCHDECAYGSATFLLEDWQMVSRALFQGKVRAVSGKLCMIVGSYSPDWWEGK